MEYYSVLKGKFQHVTGCINLEDTVAGNKPDTKDRHRMFSFMLRGLERDTCGPRELRFRDRK